MAAANYRGAVASDGALAPGLKPIVFFSCVVTEQEGSPCLQSTTLIYGSMPR